MGRLRDARPAARRDGAYNAAVTSDGRLAPVLRVAELRAIESRHSGEPLMERAGAAAAAIGREMAGEHGGRIVVLAGPGNNGGDGFVAARVLRERGHRVGVGLLGRPEVLQGDAAEMAARWVEGGNSIGALSAETVATFLAGVDVIVDALFGAGLSRPLDGPAAQVVAAARNPLPNQEERCASRVSVAVRRWS